MSQLVGYRMGTARQLREQTQEWTAERMTRFTRTKWSTSSVSLAENSPTSSRPRQFNANEIMALSRTFDLPIPYFFAPPEVPVKLPDLPGAPHAGWDYVLYRLVGDDDRQKEVGEVLGAGDLARHVAIPAGDDIENGSVLRRFTHRRISSASLLAAALHGVVMRRMRGESAVRNREGNVAEALESLSWALKAISNYSVGTFVDEEVAADIYEANRKIEEQPGAEPEVGDGQP